MGLKRYQKKRDFKKTPEPKGKVLSRRSSKKKKLFIIQKHAASHLHYDFRLELSGVLISWAVPKGPCLDPNVKRLAMHVEDHPLSYGSFEGTIPKGEYGGGTVMLWDKGEWLSLDEDPIKSYRDGKLTFILKGKKLEGKWKLFRINKDDKTWLLVKAKDEYAKPLKKYDITKVEPDSVKSGLSLEGIAENLSGKSTRNALENLPKNSKSSQFPKEISPELATLVDKPPTGKDWLHEIKLDGYRIIAFKNKDKVSLFTRNKNNWTEKFKNIAIEIKKLPAKTIIFDGEVVILDNQQRPNFQALQNSIKEGSEHFIYYIFDILYFDKYNLTSLPLIERKKILEKILHNENTILRFSDHIIGSGEKILKKATELGLEGIVSKKSDSPYIQKRTKDWLKIKVIQRQEFIIGGFTKPKNSRQFFGSLLLGTYNSKHELIYNGNVGTGFTQKSLEEIHKKLIKEITSVMPFKNRPPGIAQITWINPVLVAEVEFNEWTEENILRHPSFKGLRLDKSPQKINQEIPMAVQEIANEKTHSRKIKFTHLDKILYPEGKITKEDLVEYYEKIKKWILPYIENRPLTLVRCPQTYQHCFYQKHLNRTTPSALSTILIQENKEKRECIYITNEMGLLTLAQMNTLEIHPWGSKVEQVEYPDIITFDLDPAPDIHWKAVVAAAFDIKEQLAKIKLKSFVKTTGGKGLHVVIPIKPEYEWEVVKTFAKTFVDYLMMKHPKQYVNKMKKSERTGKIFLDYLRNQRGATAIAPYSTRARPKAPVSTPLGWDELTNDSRDTFFTIKTLPTRLDSLKRDPWKDFFRLHQSLNLDKYK